MSFGAIVVLAVGLAMDATAVAAARGAAAGTLRARDILLVTGVFGAFHALMPALGWLAGAQLGSAIEAWDHWIAFAILGLIGGKMIFEAVRNDAEVDPAPLSVKVALGLAVATSLDALAVGVTLPIVGAPPVLAIATISLVTALASLVGWLVGHRLHRSLGRPVIAVGGLVLIAMGTKILVEHLTAV